MKTKSTLVLWLCLLALTGAAQNQITTPSGQPLVIGNQGVKLSNLNSSSATQPTNGKVLSVDANGLIFLAPDASGAPSQFTNNGANIYFNTGNVGLGTNTPLQRLDVNGSINIPTGSGLRINNSLFLSAPGTANSIIGSNAGANLTSGGYNVFFGQEAGFGNSGNNTGSGNVFLGYRAGYNNTSGGNNFYMGNSAGFTNTTGIYNVMIGTSSGQFSTSNYSTFLGFSAGQYATGAYNFYLGHESGKGSVGAPNIGAANVFIGYRTGIVNTGSNNVFLGNQTGLNNTSGFGNIFIGSVAGNDITTGNNNIMLGSGASATVGNLTNATAIGTNSSVSQSNSIVLGTNATRVGINTSAPSARLHVVAGGSISNGVRFENLPTSTGTVYNLFVDGSGNLMRASSASARENFNSNDNNWILTGDEHIINNNKGAVIIGSGLTSTPNGYKLYVSEGILTERVKVAVKSTTDWRDNVLQDNYQLRTVEEVEAFIKKNRHLPGVPSAQEMVEKGNDLQRTDAILLEKVEEMMLYIIELKKENEVLKIRMSTLENKR